MRFSKTLIVVPVLALLAMGCAPRRPCPFAGPHGKYGMMAHGCGPESCVYESHCFSSGALHSNDGVCQACNGGRWVEASGCTGHHHHQAECCGHPGCPGPGACPHMTGAKGGGGKMPCGRDCPSGAPCHKR